MSTYGVTVHEFFKWERWVTIEVEADNPAEADEAIARQLSKGTLEWEEDTDYEDTEWVDYRVDGEPRGADDWSKIVARQIR